ncbi:hypothetical protein K9M74_03540 [Candidatus Woesearchaeota archaeon]|nr:hypothetical protein [Candidatus Woesearchaeota archaeon]
MLNIKPLKPSLREKKRYIVYEVTAKTPISMHTLQEELISKLHEILGVFMAGKAGILPIKYDQTTKRGIIRVNNTAVDYIRGSFILINKLGKTPVTIHTKGVSGILKKAKHNYL